jgi:prepilin-type N-terminal cleavage/methylation domain-containing protein
MMKTRKSAAGFTTLELLITVAVIAILSTIAYPSMRGLLERYRFNSLVGLTNSDLVLARLKAVSRNREYKIRLDTGNDLYTISEGNASDSSSSWTIKNQRKMSTGIDIFQIDDFNSNEAVFSPDGTVNVNNPSVDVIRVYFRGHNAPYAKRLAIETRTGRIRTELQLPNGTWKDERYIYEEAHS